jgi:hypothetical protein
LGLVDELVPAHGKEGGFSYHSLAQLSRKITFFNGKIAFFSRENLMNPVFYF